MPRTIEIEIDLDDFNDYEVLEYTYNLIKNDRNKRDYFIDLMEHIFKFDLNNLPEFDTTPFKHVSDYGAMCILDDEEIDQIRELWKELAV